MTEREQRFIEQYMICWNGAKAAEKAGYSQKWADREANRLLKRADIQATIEARKQQLVKKAEVTQEQVLQEFIRLGLSNIGDFASWEANGQVTVKPSDELTLGQKAAIQTMKSNTVSQTKDGETVTTHHLEIKLYPKEGPLTRLGEKYGLFPKDQKGATYNLQQNNFQRSTDPFPLENLSKADRETLLAIIERSQAKVVGEGNA